MQHRQNPSTEPRPDNHPVQMFGPPLLAQANTTFQARGWRKQEHQSSASVVFFTCPSCSCLAKLALSRYPMSSPPDGRIPLISHIAEIWLLLFSCQAQANGPFRRSLACKPSNWQAHTSCPSVCSAFASFRLRRGSVSNYMPTKGAF